MKTAIKGIVLLMFCTGVITNAAAASNGEIIFYDDFESGWGDWYADNGVWQIGEPNSGPGSAHQGINVGATNLSGNYPFNTDSHLISPVIVLPEMLGGDSIKLRFWQWFSYSSNRPDHGEVEIQTLEETGWSGWESLGTSADEISGGWSRTAKDLTGYAGQIVRIGFLHDDAYEDEGGTNHYHYESTGWYIDEVEVWRGVPQFINPEGFELGWGDWYADNGVWQIGQPIEGPSGAFTGEAVAGTNLSGNYPFNTDSRLIMPPVTLPSISEISVGQMLQLRYWQWFSYTSNRLDHGRVEIKILEQDGWSDWESLGVSADEISAGWSLTAKDLMEYAGKTIQIAFCHDDIYENEGGTNHYHYERAGWYIDDVEIRGLPTRHGDLTVRIIQVDDSNCPEVSSTVIVTDEVGEAVIGLDEFNFSVFEDDIIQTDITVELSREPIAAGLVMDYSASMDVNSLAAMEEAVESFINNLSSDDYAQVIKFGNGVQENIRPYTNDKDALRADVNSPPTCRTNGTTLYDAIYQAVSNAAEQSMSKVVIAITDGIDTDSVHTKDEVIDYAKEMGVVVFTIGLGPELLEDVLDEIAEQTGGVFYSSLTSEYLRTIYEKISEVIKNQYIVTYITGICQSENADGQEYEIIIRVDTDTAFGEDSIMLVCPAECDSDKN